MPPLNYLGSSFLLLCCTNSDVQHENDTNVNMTSVPNDTYIQAISIPMEFNESKTEEVKTTSHLDNAFSKGVNININLGETGVVATSQKADSKISATNRGNFVQINIFNNGAPDTLHTIIESKTATEMSSVTGDNSSPITNLRNLPWWKTSVVYQIYPRSFMDASGSGTGDLNGIASKVDYLKGLGIGAVWLSPIYVSPMADFGYDIANFTDVDPIFGTLQDFDQLLEEFHSRGIKVIMDFIPNHSSDMHPWFIKSVKRIQPYTDYYVWSSPKGYNESGHPMPPNNWVSVFGFSAWEWNEEREQFYLHQFLKEQPDLNVRNPAVMTELDNVVKFWFDRKVDGLRIDALKHMFEVEDFSLDEPVAPNSGIDDENEYYYLSHPYSTNRPETVDAVRRWRKIADTYENRMMVVEVYDKDIMEIMKYYGNETDLIATFPFNFYLITELHNRSSVSGINLRKTLDIWFDSMPAGSWPNWVLGNHDRGRVATRLGTDLVDAMNALALLLPGTPTTYYGEEIGMEDTFVTFDEAKDPSGLNFGPDRYTEFGRDPERTPMQWNSELNAGFSNGNSTWLPINENFASLNVHDQSNQMQSHLKVYQSLTKLRQERTFTHGDFDYAYVSDDILAFVRYLEREPSYLVVINTSKNGKSLNMIEKSSHSLGSEGVVTIRSSFDISQQTEIGNKISLSSLSLLGGEVLVLKLVN